jgi:hypothetical protein
MCTETVVACSNALWKHSPAKVENIRENHTPGTGHINQDLNKTAREYMSVPYTDPVWTRWYVQFWYTNRCEHCDKKEYDTLLGVKNCDKKYD